MCGLSCSRDFRYLFLIKARVVNKKLGHFTLQSVYSRRCLKMFLKVFIFAFISVALGAAIKEHRSGRIVGGQKAVEGQFPFMVALRPTTRPREHGCGGFIISNRWIGSVAHCWRNPISHLMLFAVVGTLKTSDLGIDYRFAFWMNHPEYSPYERKNDIGIGRTRTEIIFTPLVQPIPLGSDFVGAGVKATISGWGTLDFPLPIGEFAEDLHWVTLTTVTNDECKDKMYPSLRHQIYNESICTYDGPGIGACNGWAFSQFK